MPARDLLTSQTQLLYCSTNGVDSSLTPPITWVCTKRCRCKGKPCENVCKVQENDGLQNGNSGMSCLSGQAQTYPVVL